MGRLRKEKGVSSKPKSKSSKPTEDAALKEVLALGGTRDDYELVKNADKNAPTVSGPSADDPSLTQDVSSFLKGLSMGTKEKPTKTKKEKSSTLHEKAKLDKSKTKTGAPKNKADTGKKPEKHVQFESKKETPAPVTTTPLLPTKLTLNANSKFIVQPTSQWYTAIPSLKAVSEVPTPTQAQITEITSRAYSLHVTDTATFQTSSSSNSSASEASFLSKIISSGTLSDRLSALTLLVQSSPVHNMKALDNLKGMAERGKGKGGREESLKALRCIVDWWVGGGAPDRKLKSFRDQPLLHPGVTETHLVLWHFEDWLKKYFFSILQILEGLSLDSLPYVRTQTLQLIATLLRDKPEQEQNLLRLLVNKLGDTEKSLCSRASHHLLQLLQTHPSMKSIVVREVIALVLRPVAPTASTTPSGESLLAAPSLASGLPISTGKHTRFTDDDPPKPASKKTEGKKLTEKPKPVGNPHVRYYATITFNQIVLTANERTVALQLIDVYFEIFKELLGEGKDEVADDAEETTVPKRKGKGKGEDADEDEEVNLDKQGRVRVREGKAKRKHGITETKGAAGFTEVEDAHSRLISAILTGVNRALPFAGLDGSDENLNRHIDTLFLITHTSTFNISLQALVLIQHITGSLPANVTPKAKAITDRYYRTLYASLHDPRLVTSSKQAMYLNLLFKSIKVDKDEERVKALVRRFVQGLCGGGATEVVAGGLFLLGELFSTVPGLRAMLKPVESEETYDPKKRDPQYAHASASPLWELTPLLHHYHPAISLHARQLLSSQPLTATADLGQNTLSTFLDRFVYKNPKKAGTKGSSGSVMQPAATGLDGTGVKLIKGDEGGEMVNGSGFLRKGAGDVPVDQLFFHKFFSRKSEREKAKANKAGKRKGAVDDSDSDDESEEEDVDQKPEDEDEDEDSENSDAEEDEIWKVMQASMPRVNGDDDVMDDSDDIPSDLDAEDDDEDEEEQDDDEENLSMAEVSDDDDLLDLDADIPDGLIEYQGSDASQSESEEEEWGGIQKSSDKKRKRGGDDKESKGDRRKKLRSLPTFASYEDYAKMIDEAPEDDI